MVIFLADLRGVPNELKEAARIDGATTPQWYRAVIVPLLLLVHAYQQVFAQQRYGYGLALIGMFLVVIVALTYAVFKTSKYWVCYEVEQDGGKR